MNTNQYLKKVLVRETLEENGSEMHKLREERTKVEKLLQEKFVDSNPSIRYGGSKAKGTMIKSSYDLDITCYFKHDDTRCGESLEDVFNNVKDAVSAEYLPIPKTSAIRLELAGEDESGVYTHVDIVPGRYTSDDDSGDVFLHQTTPEKKRLKTNLNKHIEHIKDSGLQDIIKLVKLWKVRNSIPTKTFILELLIVKILDGRSAKELEENLIFLWEKFRDNATTLSVEDPANPEGNDLSELLTEAYVLSDISTRTLELVEQECWEDIFGDAEDMSDKDKKSSVASYVASKPNLPKPYSDD